MRNNRDYSFDFIKGIAIFLVVFGHCINEMYFMSSKCNLDIWIYSFHMPIFVFISGWFASSSLNRGVIYCLKNKGYRLLLPAFIWSSIIFLQNIDDMNVSFRLFYDSCRGLWFLWCLYALFIMASIIWKHKRKLFIAALISLGLLLLWPYYPNDILKHFKIPYYFPVFVLGAFLSKINTPPKKKQNLHIWKMIILGLSVLYLFLLVNELNKKNIDFYIYKFFMYVSTILC